MSRIIYKTIFKFRRGQSATWTKLNPILEDGEPGFELDTGRLKIGLGNVAWNDLAYFGGEAHVSADGKSIVIQDDGTLALYGFKNAEIGQVPSKDENGKLKWIAPSGDEPMSDSDIHEVIDK